MRGVLTIVCTLILPQSGSVVIDLQYETNWLKFWTVCVSGFQTVGCKSLEGFFYTV